MQLDSNLEQFVPDCIRLYIIWRCCTNSHSSPSDHESPGTQIAERRTRRTPRQEFLKALAKFRRISSARKCCFASHEYTSWYLQEKDQKRAADRSDENDPKILQNHEEIFNELMWNISHYVIQTFTVLYYLILSFCLSCFPPLATNDPGPLTPTAKPWLRVTDGYRVTTNTSWKHHTKSYTYHFVGAEKMCTLDHVGRNVVGKLWKYLKRYEKYQSSKFGFIFANWPSGSRCEPLVLQGGKCILL